MGTTDNLSPEEREDIRITRLAAVGALHDATIIALRNSVRQRLRHPAYCLPAESSDRAAIRNAVQRRGWLRHFVAQEVAKRVARGDLTLLETGAP
jgi:hypothetical protein